MTDSLRVRGRLVLTAMISPYRYFWSMGGRQSGPMFGFACDLDNKPSLPNTANKGDLQFLTYRPIIFVK